MQSLRVKLITPFIIGTVALTVLLAWYTYSSARQAVEDAMLLISEAKTNHASSSMSLLFKSMSTSLQNMVVDPHVTALFDPQTAQTAKTKTADWLSIITQGNEYYRDILIVDKKGICVASSNPGLVRNSYMQKPYVQQALGGMFTLGESTVGRVTKKFSSTIAGPIDVSGGVVGALIIISDFPKIVDYATKSTHDSEIIFTAMLTPEGLFTAHKNNEIMGNESKLFPELYATLASVGEKGATVEYELLGKTYVGYAKLEPTSKWIILTSGVKSDVFAPAYRVGLVVLGISAVICGVIAFMVIRFANGILVSLLSLIQYAKSVSEGNLSLKLAGTERNDELGILHNALQRLVHALQSMLEKTQEASKMKGEFLANMSHEIRTPLNAIIGMTHLSLRDGSISDKQRGYLDKIQLAARSLLGVINDILDISKVEAGMLAMENTTFNLRETINNILSIHQETASVKALELTADYAPDMPEHFIGDPLRIGQILNNLLSNAIKFTLSGSVSVHCWQEKHKTENGLAIVHVSVTDTGIGISQDVLATLFQPFTQADASITRQFGGTGLGLAISHRLVELMGGSFSVTSEPGKGTVFGFSMHLEVNEQAADSTLEELPLDVAFEQLGLAGKRILVAEDNEINQLIIQELLLPSGATLTMAENGQEAVDAVRAQDFDLVFMDMQMPVMDGLEATHIIRAFKDSDTLPIIAVTANAMKEDQDRGFASGMNGYLTKPIEPRQLLEVLRDWLVESRKD